MVKHDPNSIWETIGYHSSIYSWLLPFPKPNVIYTRKHTLKYIKQNLTKLNEKKIKSMFIVENFGICFQQPIGKKHTRKDHWGHRTFEEHNNNLTYLTNIERFPQWQNNPHFLYITFYLPKLYHAVSQNKLPKKVKGLKPLSICSQKGRSQ